mmetsp:Transcript_14771/g.18901  ORF Transcript_14771/g.18901 Transcript_14771/m.18901 type:complete len:304 (-) Transcript_14771:501-1412(-)
MKLHLILPCPKPLESLILLSILFSIVSAFSIQSNHHVSNSRLQLQQNNKIKDRKSCSLQMVLESSVIEEIEGKYDEDQVQMMEERVILVDDQDNIIGEASKAETHMAKYGLLLHRAFSVFLFDNQGRMLLQQRAGSKITFPLYWTNTCCSHPLHIPSELGHDADTAVQGAKNAAVRKLNQELGIPETQLPTEDFTYLTKIHYIADSDPIWGEHEVDYVFFINVDNADLSNLNYNEVEDVKYVTQTELKQMLADADAGKIKFTPWSRLIIDEFIYKWWPSYADKEALKSMADPFSKVHKLGEHN